MSSAPLLSVLSACGLLAIACASAQSQTPDAPPAPPPSVAVAELELGNGAHLWSDPWSPAELSADCEAALEDAEGSRFESETERRAALAPCTTETAEPQET